MNKRPIIINTDPGIDNALAITIALFSDELNVRLISTVAGNVNLDRATYNALRLSRYLGREDVLVTMGADRSLIHKFKDTSSIHGRSGVEGFDFEEPTQQLSKGNAIDAIHSVIMNSNEPAALVPIAPLINIALLLKTYSEMKRSIREIVPTGDSTSRGNKSIMAEFNTALDPEATHMVFHSGVKLTMVGLDVGLKALILSEGSEEARTMNEIGEMAYYLSRKYRGGSFRTGLKMYDVTAVAYLLRPGLFKAVETHLDVELHDTMTASCMLVGLKGYLGKEPNATVCLGIDGNVLHT